MKILVITSCTGEKAVESRDALTLDDFRNGPAQVRKRERALADLLRDVFAPWFGAGRWAVPVLLVVFAIWIERRSATSTRAPLRIALALIALVAVLGMIEIVAPTHGGRIGAIAGGAPCTRPAFPSTVHPRAAPPSAANTSAFTKCLVAAPPGVMTTR